MSETTATEKRLKAIEGFRLFDDTFMSAVFDGQIPATELLLKAILSDWEISVVSCEAQYYLSNIYGRETKLDILARSADGAAYHVEVQRDLTGASVQRARFSAAMVDVTLLQKGQPHQEMPERYTIFITEKDMFGRGAACYHAENRVAELDNAPLCDGGHIIYVNGEYRDLDTPIGQLMHDFFCVDPDDIIDPILRERVRYLKQTEGGRDEMCKIMENMINEEKIELAKDAIKRGNLTLEQIAETLKLPLAFVQELARQKSA